MAQPDPREPAMRRALELAATPGTPLGPNPRVGCVLLDHEGRTVGEGFHRGAGTPHAEVAALADAGERARGATAVVTLEPCRHTGRTGPCTEALLAAGVAEVVYAVPDPTSTAGGGADVLRAAGVPATPGLLAHDVEKVLAPWRFGLEHGRPWVRWKVATTLDGRIAASDGSSRWITSPTARADTHRLRAECDVVLVGTGTALVDDPWLTVRDGAGALADHQPLRAVMGERDVPPGAKVLDDAAETIHLRTRDPHHTLSTLFEQGRRRVFLEGGPTVAAAFLGAGLVDEVVAYVAPTLLGAGPSMVGDLGISTISEALSLTPTDVTVLGPDVRFTLTPTPTRTEERR